MFLSHDLGKNKYTMCVECTPREARRLNLCITNRKLYDQVFGGTFLKTRSVKPTRLN